MLHRVLNVISFRADEKRQKLAINIGGNIPKTLIGDDQRLAQVIANLMGNAAFWRRQTRAGVSNGQGNTIPNLKGTVWAVWP
jgi:C4-dicarboxylate-specific signal transduction histidine kinase